MRKKKHFAPTFNMQNNTMNLIDTMYKHSNIDLLLIYLGHRTLLLTAVKRLILLRRHRQGSITVCPLIFV